MRYVRPSPSSWGMTYSPIIGMKTRMLPVTSPGSVIGRVTWRKVDQRPAPRSFEASIRDRSMRSSVTYSGNTISGR